MRPSAVTIGSGRIRLLLAVGVVTLVASGSFALLPDLTSSATTSLPPPCAKGQHLTLSGKPACDPAFTSARNGANTANVPLTKQKTWEAALAGGKAAYGAISKGIPPKPIPTLPKADYVSNPNGTIQLVNFHGIKVASHIANVPSQMVPSTFSPPFSPTNMWAGWSGNMESQVVAGMAAGTTGGRAGVVVRTAIETVQTSPTSGVLVEGPVNGPFFVTPNVSGSLRIVSVSGGVLKLNLVGTSTYYYFNTSNFTYQ